MWGNRTLVLLWLACALAIPQVLCIDNGNPVLYEKYKGLEEFGVEDAWDMGYTGKGVKVAVIDESGVDFATPDLIGTQARVSDPISPYDGWPIVIDLVSLENYQQGLDSTQYYYANTSSTDMDDYRVTETSKSGVYHIGEHPDLNLFAFYGQVVKVLVVDENIAGIYDTVYVDLNNNRDFSDDKPCRKGDEISYWDRNDDGYPDESGGMIYFIADGKIPLPFSEMLYGNEAKVPENGELVAFHIAPSSHGTMCASIIAAQGKNVKGIAPDAKLIPVKAYGARERLMCILSSLGYDGIPGTGDDADVISRSGVLSYFQKGADETSTFLEYLTTEISPNTTIVYGNGNDGSGYGTCGSPCSEHVINAGAIYDMWWNGSSYRGDVTCFSARGPNVLGQVKPNVLATGYWSPESKPLWQIHDGKAAWNAWGGGTSGATPHVAAVVALIYQAYKDTYGEFPSSETARDILMSSATNVDEEVFAQGSGIINAKRAVDMASKKGGILIEPALLATSPVKAGSELVFKFNVTNYSGDSFDLKPQRLMKDDKREFVLNSKENVFLSIPKEMMYCDLLKVSLYYPRDATNTKVNVVDDEFCDGYNLILYNWNDENSDGKFASDDGHLNGTQVGELEPVAIGAWGSVFTSEVRMHNPADRTDDGLVAGLLSLYREDVNEGDEVHLVVETYSWEPWDLELDLEGSQVCCTIPVPNATGVYGGRILLEYGDEETCIPLSFAAYRNDDVIIGDDQDIYENDVMYGRFEGDGKGLYDSRFYPIYHSGHDLATIEVSWDDPKTDIDVYLYGEGTKEFSSLWDYSTEPPIELPELPVLKENGHSTRTWRTRVNQYAVASGAGGSYSTVYTSTGENKEVITGELTDGMNVLVLNQVVPGGNKYGDNITIKIDVEPLIPSTDLKATAGDFFDIQLTGADEIVGFSSGEPITSGASKVFEASEGDMIMFLSNSATYSPNLFFDENGNGIIYEDGDEIVFGESKYGFIDMWHADMIPLSLDGTYILTDFEGDFYHMKNRYALNDVTPIEIKAPEKAGTYLGIAERAGNLLSNPLRLVVEPGVPSSLHMSSLDRIGCNVPFDVDFELCDAYGNQVAENTTATVDLDGTVNNVQIVNGVGSATLNGPNVAGIYKITSSCPYGSAEKDVEITDEAIVEIENVSFNAEGVLVNLKNNGGSDIELEVYANPSTYMGFDPDTITMVSAGFYRSMFSHGQYLQKSGNIGLSIRSGEERDLLISTPEAVSFEDPYIVVVTSTNGDVVAYREINRPDTLPDEGGELKEMKDVKTAFVNKPVSFKAQGLISLQLNDHQPLFFVTQGAFFIYPDEVGELKVTMNNSSHTIVVVAEDDATLVGEQKLVNTASIPKVESVSVSSKEGRISVVWNPVNGADRYNVYLFKYNRLELLDDVSDPEYSMDGELWTMYPFRIAAVDEVGNEGLLSDPVGIVAIP